MFCTTHPTIAHFRPRFYQGTWWEIARYNTAPYFPGNIDTVDYDEATVNYQWVDGNMQPINSGTDGHCMLKRYLKVTNNGYKDGQLVNSRQYRARQPDVNCPGKFYMYYWDVNNAPFNVLAITEPNIEPVREPIIEPIAETVAIAAPLSPTIPAVTPTIPTVTPIIPAVTPTIPTVTPIVSFSSFAPENFQALPVQPIEQNITAEEFPIIEPAIVTSTAVTTEVQILKPNYEWPYWIHWTDYSNYAIVGGPGNDYLWVLSRRQQIFNSEIPRLMKLVHCLGYDPSRLISNPKSIIKVC